MALLAKSRATSSYPEIEETLLSGREIARRVKALAREISGDYKGRSPVLAGVLKGSFVFLADLIRNIKIPVELDFMSLSSYAGDSSTGMVKLSSDTKLDLRGRHVILVDDIVDTGFSLAWARKHLLTKEPASLEVCVLLDKPPRRKVFVPVRYTGFTIADRFVVGYGLDYNERFRELPYIGALTPESLQP